MQTGLHLGEWSCWWLKDVLQSVLFTTILRCVIALHYLWQVRH